MVGESDFNENPFASLDFDLDFDLGFVKKIYPNGHVKKIGYFPTLGGRGGSLNSWNFSTFFLNPSLI